MTEVHLFDKKETREGNEEDDMEQPGQVATRRLMRSRGSEIKVKG